MPSGYNCFGYNVVGYVNDCGAAAPPPDPPGPPPLIIGSAWGGVVMGRYAPGKILLHTEDEVAMIATILVRLLH